MVFYGLHPGQNKSPESYPFLSLSPSLTRSIDSPYPTSDKILDSSETTKTDRTESRPINPVPGGTRYPPLPRMGHQRVANHLGINSNTLPIIEPAPYSSTGQRPHPFLPVCSFHDTSCIFAAPRELTWPRVNKAFHPDTRPFLQMPPLP